MLRSIRGVVGIRFVTAFGSPTCRQPAVSGLQLAGAHQIEQTREVKQQATEIRSGQIIDLKGRLMQIQKYQHTQGSGRQLGNVQANSDLMIRLELRDLKSGSKHQQRCRSYDTVDVVRLDDRTYKYLYTEGSQLHFMHPDTYEQETVDKELFGDMYDYFIEDMEAFLSFHEGEVVAGSLPQQVLLNVVSTDTVAKGNEKSPQYKPAVVGSGRKIMVPPFITTGEQILVDTREGTFVKRAK
ncbi:hypothetical protein WJX82_003609 [Trebouxia sp. C0006]